MSLQLFAHPFSSYCQKVLVALYEYEIPFEWRLLAPGEELAQAEHAALWPLRRMPLLLDGAQAVMEASVIIEYLGPLRRAGDSLMPGDTKLALEVRTMDRVFDNYVMTPMQKIVFDCLRAPGRRDAQGVEEARQMLDASYAWLDQKLQGRTWAAMQTFSLADCAAAPALFYADWVHPIADSLHGLRRYRQRLLEHPSFARAVEEARPYRNFFPPGAPDRD